MTNRFSEVFRNPRKLPFSGARFFRKSLSSIVARNSCVRSFASSFAQPAPRRR
jgi:hypothetical protein